MKLSVVTISFNQAQFLERAITSVLSQEGVDLEYIIVDPGSTDGSRDIIEKYRSHFAKVIYEKDRGPADGLNKGFAAASGDWFAYLNSDDYYLPGGLQQIMREAEKNPLAGALVGNGYTSDENEKIIKPSISQKFSLRRMTMGAAFSLQQATIYRADAFRRVGGFNVSNHTCWDGEILVDLALSGEKICRIWQDIGVFRLYADSISGSGRLNEAYIEDLKRQYRKILGRDPSALERHILKPFYRLIDRIVDGRRTFRILRSRFIPDLPTGVNHSV